MSRTIDERVVSMQFDNKHFESNVKTSLSTLEKLKQSLNLKGSAKGLESINTAAKNCNLAPVSNAVESVRVRFSALEVMAVTALANITNSAINAGKRIASALTIQPIRTGFQEYETQINAVQTILANTKSKGTTLDDVNAALDELNTYADKTIYNFTEMTRNIGTFTAAGVDLDKSVQSIKGIANLAAVSGSTSQQAATAMYQLSQALAAGKVQLMDWNSVVNAGMGGEVFQNALKRTATQMGHNVDEMIKKYGSFRESLTQGEWLTAEVLTETLAQLSGAYTEADLIAQGYTEKQAKEIVELADTAESAATDVKTFTQLLDTLKESAQSGWTQTWELIVGDFESAKKLWTGVSETIGGFINNMSESRNSLLEGALTSKWDKMIGKINEAGIETSKFEEKVKEVAKSHNIDIDTILSGYDSFEDACRKGGISTKILKEAVDELSGSLVDLSKIDRELGMNDRGEDVKKVQKALRELGYDLGKFGEDGVDGIIGTYTEAAIKSFQEAQGLKVTGIVDEETLAALEKANSGATNLKESIGGLIDEIDELGGRELLIKALGNAWKAIVTPIKAVKEAWGEVFEGLKPEQLYSFIEGFHSFTENLIMSEESADKVRRVFKGLFSVLEIFTNILGGGLKLGFKTLNALLGKFDLNLLDVAAAAGDALTNLRDWIFENGVLAKSFDYVISGIANGIKTVRDWVNAFIQLPEVQEKIEGIKEAFSDGTEAVKNFFSGGLSRFSEFIEQFRSMDSFSLDDLIDVFKNLKDNVIEYFTNFDASEIFSKMKKGFENVRNAIADFLENVAERLGVTKEKFEEFRNKLSLFFNTIKEKIGDHKGAIVAVGTLLTMVFMLSKIKKALGAIAKPFEAFSGIGESISGFIDSLKDVQKAKANKIKTDAIYNIAKSIAMLAASVWIIAKIPKDDVWRAVGIIGILSGLVIGMMALSKLIDNKLGVGSEASIIKFGSMIRNMGLAFLLMAASIKILGGMETGDLIKGGVAVTTFLGITVGLMAATKLIGDKDIAQFGKMIRKLSTALLILSAVIYILGKMDTDTLVQGGLAVTYFLGIMAGAMVLSGKISKDSNEFGKMIRNLSFSLILLAGAVVIFGKMKTETLIKGGLAITVFLGIMLSAMSFTKPMSKDIAQFGKMMLSLSAALILMAVAVKILGEMDTETMIRGTLAVAAFGGIVVGLMAATKLLGKHSYNAGKMGLLLLSFAGSVLLITGAIAALSMLDTDDIIKAELALAGIGAIFAGMLLVTKHAKNVNTGTIIGLSAALAIMAGSLIALSFVDTKKLLAASASLGIVMGMFSLLAYSAKSIKPKTLASLAGMILIVGGLGLLITGLTKYVDDADKALKVSVGISALITSLSASCLLLSKVGKVGAKNAFIGVGVLGAVMGLVGIFAGIAIWQLPNIARQLSKFMKELEPFLSGIEGVDSSLLGNIKTLGEAMSAFAGAGAKFAFAEALTWGGSSRAFTKFVDFIKEIIPVIKDVALDVSGEDVNINYDNLNAIISAVKGLAEAAGEIPSSTAALAITKFGGGGFISIPNLRSFISFIKEAVPVIKDLALELSTGKVDVNINNLNAVVGAVGDLAEAASKVPTTTIAGGFGKFAGGWGAGGAISIPGLTEFITFVKEIVPVMSGFTIDISKTDISTEDASALKSICESIGVLATAADSAPSYDLMGGFAKFAGGWGVAGGVSVPGLLEFIAFVKEIVPVMSGLTLDVAETSITESDAQTIGSICQAVSYLGEAAGKAPSHDIAVGFAKFAVGAGGGAYISIPDLESFVSFVKEVVPIMSGFTIDAEAAGIDENDATVIGSICQAIGYLGEAANNAPSTDVAAGLANIGPVIAGGMYISSTDLTSFKDWIADVAPVMSGFALDVQEAKLEEGDVSKLTSICEAVKILAEASKAAPKDEMYAGVFGNYVSTTNLTDFKDWIVDVVPVMADLTSGISEATSESGTSVISDEDVKTIQSISNSVKILADAAALAPKEEAYSNIFGSWVKTTDLQGFTDWIGEVITVLQDLGSKLAESDVTVDTATLQGIAKAASDLGASAYWFTSALNFNMFIDIETAKQYITDITGLIESFAEDMSSIDVESAKSGATAIKDLTTVLQNLSGFTYTTVDTESFSTKISELASAVDDFATDMEEVDLTTAATKVTALEGIVKTLSEIDTSGVSDVAGALQAIATLDLSGLNNIGDSFKTLGTTCISDFVKTITDGGPKVAAAANHLIVKLMNSINDKRNAVTKTFENIVSSMLTSTKNKYSSFYNVGRYLVQGFADGISANTFMASAKAKAMALKAYEAAKKALDVNSPSKIFRSLGTSVPEGFAMGIDKMGRLVRESSVAMAGTAIDGTRNAIGRIVDVINSDVETQPTIRPVLDLSDVRSNASLINDMLNTDPSMRVISKVGTINTMMNQRQNGTNSDVISAIENLGRKLGNTSGDTYNINGVTYDDGSNITDAVKTLVRAAKVERRR